MFSTKVGEVECAEDDGDDLCSDIIAATLFGQSSRDNPSGIQCEFSGNMADHLQDGKIVFNDQNSLQQCWEVSKTKISNSFMGLLSLFLLGPMLFICKRMFEG